MTETLLDRIAMTCVPSSTSFKIKFTELELEDVKQRAAVYAKWQAAWFFEELGWSEPERQQAWLAKDPTLIEVADPTELESQMDGSMGKDEEITYSCVNQSFLDAVSPIVEQMEIIESHYVGFAVADIEDQRAYISLVQQLVPYLTQDRLDQCGPNFFSGIWWGGFLRTFPQEVHAVCEELPILVNKILELRQTVQPTAL
jgi:hypothetical protein